jgi:hypothetical protein
LQPDATESLRRRPRLRRGSKFSQTKMGESGASTRQPAVSHIAGLKLLVQTLDANQFQSLTFCRISSSNFKENYEPNIRKDLFANLCRVASSAHQLPTFCRLAEMLK